MSLWKEKPILECLEYPVPSVLTLYESKMSFTLKEHYKYHEVGDEEEGKGV